MKVVAIQTRLTSLKQFKAILNKLFHVFKHLVRNKAMRSDKRYVSSAKNPEFGVIPMSVITVINVRLPLR